MNRTDVMEDLNKIREALKKAGWENPTLQDCIAVAQLEWFDVACDYLAAIEVAINLAAA